VKDPPVEAVAGIVKDAIESKMKLSGSLTTSREKLKS
jgi:hypothetical protein